MRNDEPGVVSGAGPSLEMKMREEESGKLIQRSAFIIPH
jgi:hypothetical protein